MPSPICPNRSETYLRTGLLALLLTQGCTARDGVVPPVPAALEPGTFSVAVSGTGRPVLFIPGLSSAGAVWDPIIERLDGVEAHVLTIGGFGGAPPSGVEPLLESVAAEIIAYVAGRGLESPVAVGHSLGATVAFLAAARAPARIGAVVSVDGLPYFPAVMNPAATPESMRTQAEMMRRAVAAQTPNEFAAAQAQYAPGNATDPAHVQEIARMMGRSDPATVAQAMYELMITDARPLLDSIRAPILVYGSWVGYGTREQVRANFDAQFRNAPDVRLGLSEDGRHFLMYDDPDGLVRALIEFLDL